MTLGDTLGYPIGHLRIYPRLTEG
ncbi:hypothetical protein QIH97_gp18 [Enterobacter phage KNP3]|nr:hypothetical protein QIH97_gp18 [Enterobacter phage KNP3]